MRFDEVQIRVVDWGSIHSDSAMKHKEWLQDRCREVYQDLEGDTRLALTIGSFHGATDALIAQYFPCVIAVDIWAVRVEHMKYDFDTMGMENLDKYLKNMIRVGVIDRVHPVVADSSFLLEFPPLYANLIFIDGGHDYETVSKDLQSALRHREAGCPIICHDYHPTWPEVERAVDEFIGCYDFEIYSELEGIVALREKV